MKVTTKNYRLEKNDYIKMALKAVLVQQWWAVPIALVICCGWFWVPSFWWIQFFGITQLDQGKMLFERFSYEITSQQILMKLSAREGMPIKWEQILRAKAEKDYFLLFVNKAQLIYWPYKIFNTDNERKFVLSILKNKGLVR